HIGQGIRAQSFTGVICQCVTVDLAARLGANIQANIDVIAFGKQPTIAATHHTKIKSSLRVAIAMLAAEQPLNGHGAMPGTATERQTTHRTMGAIGTNQIARRNLLTIDRQDDAVGVALKSRSEERRVGKECRSRWSA